jgi:hypothetical protein
MAATVTIATTRWVRWSRVIIRTFSKGWGSGLDQALGPGLPFTLAEQTGKEVGNRCEQVHFQHERHPLRETKANRVKEVASLAMARQTLRSINYPLVSAVLLN